MLGCILKSKDPSPKWNLYKCIRGNNRRLHKSKQTLRLELVIFFYFFLNSLEYYYYSFSERFWVYVCDLFLCHCVCVSFLC